MRLTAILNEKQPGCKRWGRLMDQHPLGVVNG
jgi:hypothetical protein